MTFQSLVDQDGSIARGGVKILNIPDLTVPGLRSGTSLEVAPTRTEVRMALP
jgi:hypothetical protein